jgi:iron(III) transport system ATP-binding protein
VAELLEAVGLSGLGKRYPHQLSGGQQQRVALARALAVEPRLVLLDEPFGSLDASLRASVRADVRRALAGAGTTAILVTHDQDEAMSLADQLAVIRDGRIAQYGTPRDVYTRPVDAQLAGFLGLANLLDGVVDTSSRTVDTILGRLPLDLGLPIRDPTVSVLVRPEQLVLRPAPGGTTDGESAGGERPTARVVGYDFHGHDATVRLTIEQTASHPEVHLVARAAGSPQFEQDSEVILSASGPVIVWPGRGVDGTGRS